MFRWAVQHESVIHAVDGDRGRMGKKLNHPELYNGPLPLLEGLIACGRIDNE